MSLCDRRSLAREEFAKNPWKYLEAAQSWSERYV